MSLIRLDQKYDEFYSLGCSFTTGFMEGSTKSWGYYFAQKIGANPNVVARDGAGNYMLMFDIMKICEMNKGKKIAIGIQLTERNRREIWIKDTSTYHSFNYATLTINKKNNVDKELHFLKDNLKEISHIFFDDFENYLRTLTSVIMIKNYLENKGVDYIIFEGMTAISDYKDLRKNLPQHMKNYVSDELVGDIVNSPTFFKKYGPMQPFCRTHELYDVNKNGGHPNSDFIKWWVDEMIEHIRIN